MASAEKKDEKDEKNGVKEKTEKPEEEVKGKNEEKKELSASSLKERKLLFGRRGSKDKSKDPKARWGKAITGVRAAGKVMSLVRSDSDFIFKLWLNSIYGKGPFTAMN